MLFDRHIQMSAHTENIQFGREDVEFGESSTLSCVVLAGNTFIPASTTALREMAD